MPTSCLAAAGLLAQLDLFRIKQPGSVGQGRLKRPSRRNAINDALAAQLQTAFVDLPEAARAVLLSGEGTNPPPKPGDETP